MRKIALGSKITSSGKKGKLKLSRWIKLFLANNDEEKNSGDAIRTQTNL